MTASSRADRPQQPLERLPRWLVGDWTVVVRDPVDLFRLAFLIGVPITLALGPREQSFRLLLTFLLCLIPRALNVPRAFDLAFVLAMSFQAWGNVFGAFDGVYGYDKVVHFLLPTALAPLLYLLLVRLRVVPDLAEESRIHRQAGMLLVAWAMGYTLGGGLYELYEWFGDHVLGAHLYTSYGDSIGDLTDDALGSLAGAGLLLVWDAYGWGTQRRSNLPGRSGEDDPLAAAADRLIDRWEPEAEQRRVERPIARLPKWLAGDWGRVLRDPLDIARLTFLVGLVLALAQGEWETAARFAITFGALVVVRLLNVPRPLDLAFVIAMAVQAWGAYAHAFRTVGGYGPGVHVLVSAAAAPILYIALIRLQLVPDLIHRRRLHHLPAVALVTFTFGFSVGVLYELYVFFADHVLAASFRVDYPLFVQRLAMDALGAALAAVFMVFWASASWSTRRVPGRRLHGAG